MESSSGYTVVPAELTGASRAVDDVLGDVLGELGSLGVGVGLAEAGRGMWALAASTGPAGHAGLHAAFGSFCDRWGWGVRALVQAGREMADGLAAASVAYAGADRDQRGLFQRIVEIGDPGPDLTPAEAGRSMGEIWAAVGKDVAEASASGHVDDLAALRESVG